MKKNKTVWIIVTDSGQGPWPPNNAVEFIEFFSDKLASVPPEYRDTVCIDIGADPYYGDEHPTLNMYYIRPETDEEIAQAQAEEAERRADMERRERALFNTLSVKYGDAP